MMLDCPCCGSDQIEEIAQTPPLPVNACTLTNDAETSRNCARRPISLMGCDDCSFLWNSRFEEELLRYDTSYEGTQIHSPHFRAYLADSAREWVKLLGSNTQRIFEVGCGQGEFLEVLAGKTNAELSGCDPAYRGDTAMIHNVVLSELAGDRYDAVINRMTLEHVAKPYGFIKEMADFLTDDGCLITQVPNAALMVENALFCDLIYEHVNYFNAYALVRMLERLGFQSNHCKLSYDDQHLTVFSYREAGRFDQTTPYEKPSLQSFQTLASGFSAAWDARLSSYRKAGRDIYVWGAGSRATTFLNALQTSDIVKGVIDINPRRDGTFVQGTACLTHRPEKLCHEIAPIVILMNPIYKREIQSTLDDLSVQAELLEVS